MSILPWQTAQWTALIQRISDNNLPHAMLLTGIEGIGKRQFAMQFAHALLCEHPDESGQACGECKSCHLIAAGSHPDFLDVAPEEEGKAIKVDQVRQISTFSALSAHLNGYKVIVVSPAENMNRAAANSILKTLEEPNAHTLLLLVSSAPQRLLPTVRSRCQQVLFPTPSTELASQWLDSTQPGCDAGLLLEMAGGAPLTARQFSQNDAAAQQYKDYLANIIALLDGSQDPISVANNWQKSDAVTVLDWFSDWVMDIIRLSVVSTPPKLASPTMQSHLHGLAKQLELKAVHQFLTRLYQARRLATTSQVNALLLFEELLIRWSALPRNKA